MLSHLTSREGLTILLVDQEIRHALKIADHVYVLELGRNKYEGPVSGLRRTSRRRSGWPEPGSLRHRKFY